MMHHRNERESIKHLKQTKKTFQIKQPTKITCSDFLETKRAEENRTERKAQYYLNTILGKLVHRDQQIHLEITLEIWNLELIEQDIKKLTNWAMKVLLTQ